MVSRGACARAACYAQTRTPNATQPWMGPRAVTPELNPSEEESVEERAVVSASNVRCWAEAPAPT